MAAPNGRGPASQMRESGGRCPGSLFALLLPQGSKMAASLAWWWPATVALGLAGKQLARGEERGAS